MPQEQCCASCSPNEHNDRQSLWQEPLPIPCRMCCCTLLCHVQAGQGSGARPVREAGMGVYVGISYAEYAQAAARAMPTVSTYTATGGALSVAAGALASLI